MYVSTRQIEGTTLFYLVQNPDYMKDGFHITIETIHVPNDKGLQHNVSKRSPVVRVMIAYLFVLLRCTIYQKKSFPKEMLCMLTLLMTQCPQQ